MSVSDYRKQYEAQLAAEASHAKVAKLATPSPMMGVVARAEAVSAIGASKQATASDIKKLVVHVGNATEDARVRTAALLQLNLLEFTGPRLDAQRVSFVKALESAAGSGDKELATAALAQLAARKEDSGRTALLGHLANPAGAPMPLDQTIRLLSNYDHDAVFAPVRDILAKTRETDVKAAALRLLAADKASEKLITTLLNDTTQPIAIRSLAATGLHNLNPDSFAKIGRAIVDDSEENDDVRATCLSLLTHFSDYEKQRSNKRFAASVKRLSTGAGSVHLKAAAARFMDRIEQDRK